MLVIGCEEVACVLFKCSQQSGLQRKMNMKGPQQVQSNVTKSLG